MTTQRDQHKKQKPHRGNVWQAQRLALQTIVIKMGFYRAHTIVSLTRIKLKQIIQAFTARSSVYSTTLTSFHCCPHIDTESALIRTNQWPKSLF